MTAIALLSVAPAGKESMGADVADAVAAPDEFDVHYETNPMGTVVEADDAATLFAAAEAAHEAVGGDRVSTFLKIDDKRTDDRPARTKVESVAHALGRPPRRDRGDRAESGDGTGE